MLSGAEIRDIITSLRSRGLEVGLRDMSFAVLSIVYDDERLAYRSVFGENPDVSLDEYMGLEKVMELISCVEPFFPEEQSVTFDELKSGLIQDLRALERLRDQKDGDGNSPLDAKEMATVVARIADIRVKLTEKFNTTERIVEQRVEVMQKFTGVCACGREIAFPLAPEEKKTLF